MRPLGVTLLGIYQILRGAFGILFALALMLTSSLAAKFASVAAEGHAVGNLLQNFGRLAGLGILIFALMHLLAGVGLLKMQNWGRLLTLLLSAIGLVALLPVLTVAHGLPLVFGLINAIAIFYLAMPPTKRAFHTQKPILRAAA